VRSGGDIIPFNREIERKEQRGILDLSFRFLKKKERYGRLLKVEDRA
jgi:hypothetical protein